MICRVPRAPAYQRRAPLRRVRAGATSPGSCPVLPPINGGLHCGFATSGDWLRNAPPCSRLSTAGSIAARFSLTCAAVTPRGCSRLSTAGSIAAHFIAWSPPAGHSRAPAYQRRAPLRPGHRYPPGRLERRAPAYQRRAPLRPRGNPCVHAGVLGAPAYQRRAPLRPCRTVRPRFPADPCSRLSTAGSIAATRTGCKPASTPWCSRLSTAGSIAAASPSTHGNSCGQVLPPINGGLHCGHEPGPCPPSQQPGAPAYQRRAPLRHVIGQQRQRGLGPVLPPINGGLHCG